MEVAEHRHQHQPIAVYDGLQVDEHGRPARWLYHVECLICGRQFLRHSKSEE